VKNASKLPWRILTAGFLAIIFLFGTMTMILDTDTLVNTTARSFQMSRSEGKGIFAAMTDSIDALETEYNMVFFSKSSYLAGNILVKKILGHEFFPDASDDMTMVRLTDGSISKVKFSMHSEACQAPLRQFKDYLDEMGIPLIFVYVHTEILEPEEQLPFGTVDLSNQHADQFLRMLDKMGIDYIDTREVLLDMGRPVSELYFRTDTHWTIPSAFAVYQTLARRLNEQYGFEINEKFIDAASYETELYEDIFLGSYGHQTTPYYTGTEDFEIVVPTFETNLTERTQRNDNNWIIREGTFAESVLHLECLEPDEGVNYSSHCYQTYNYNWGEVLYENHDPDADNRSVLFIKTSCGNPITDFMALGVENVCGLDRRNLTRTTIAEYTADYQPDAVVIVYNYDFLRSERLDFFTAPAAADNEGV